MSGLMPREHGAYAQLGFPLLTGLILAGGDPGAVAFAVAAVALFLAHEPLAVLAGVRGARLQGDLATPARRRALFLAGAAMAGLAAAIGLAPPLAWMSAILPGGLGILLLPLLGTRRMKTIPAEVIAVAVFSTSVLPLALCGSTDLHTAGLAAALWVAAFVPSIFAVHAVKAALKKRPEERWILRAAPTAALLTLAAVLAGAALLPAGPPLLAAVPPVVVALGVAARPPHPRQLKRLGWAMVSADALALVLFFGLARA
jgi:hypothetical protein